MKTIEYELNGKTFHLAMNGCALFDVYDKYGTDKNVLELIEGTDKKTFERLCWLLYKFAEQGELVRRYQGFDRGPVATEEFFKVNLKALDVALAKLKLKDVIIEGFKREEVDDKPVDLLLLEAQKKKETP